MRRLMRIALLEDDHDQADLVKLWLTEAGHTVFHYDHGQAFKAGMKQQSVDLLIMDWMLPDTEGIDVLTWVRNVFDWHIPVIFQTQRDAEEDIVRALQVGADDYMVKPVRHAELLARIESVARRTLGQDEANEQVFGVYRLDIDNMKVFVNEEPLDDLTSKEFSLIRFLFNHAGRALSRDHILENVWGTTSAINTRKIDTHISRIRSKLNLQESNGWRLSSIYQYGYRLEKVEATE